MSRLGRLPPLQVIGKSYSIDLDEPPDDIEDSELDELYRQYNNINLEDSEDSYFFELAHADEAAHALGKVFKVVTPGDHVCKRTSPHATGFSHCKKGADVGKRYKEMRQLLAARAKLQLVRDYTSRLNAAALFVKDLELTVEEEYETWYHICKQSLEGAPLTKLECLSAICEDLRVHMNHWNSIKQLLHTDQWLQQLLPSLSRQMDAVRRQLLNLRDSSIWWVYRLICVGLQVLAHCDLEKLTQDALWSITRGLEDFNLIVMAIRSENCLVEQYVKLESSSMDMSWRQETSACMNSYKNIGESIRPIPFLRVLNILANERSKYAAIMTHRFFTTGDEFVRLVQCCKLSDYAWNENLHKGDKQQPVGANTSDYHSGSGSYVSVGTAMLRVGNVIAPDLSKQMSPVVDFARREQEFASKFLQIVCHSTNLLKPSPEEIKRSGVTIRDRHSFRNHTPRSMRKTKEKTNNERAKEKETKKKDTIDPRSDCPARKSVSWGDAADSSVKQQLTSKYLELLWQYFGTSLSLFYSEMLWGGAEAVQGQLGHVLQCSDTTLMLLVRMMYQCCVKDMFPEGAVQSLFSVGRRLEVSAAWSSWDAGLCCALASQVGDKCYPTMLANGEYSTRTAMLLRDAYQPLHSVLHLLDSQMQDDNKGANGLVNCGRGPHLKLLLPSLQRALTTCEETAKWCRTKAYQFLSSWALGSFLLITQSDLKLLCDETKQVVYLSQRICSQPPATPSSGQSPQDIQLAAAVNQLWQQLNDVSAQLQTLSGSTVKSFSEKCNALAMEFFQEAMPVGKIWRKKSSQEVPSQPNEYAEQAMDSLVEPVVAGVSKLKTTAQLSAIAMAVVAMCDAWTAHILKQKIRFSLQGACQLQLDFGYVRTWLETCVNSEEVRQSVLALDCLKYLDGIVALLKRQPRGRTPSRPPKDRRSQLDDTTAGQELKSARSKGYVVADPLATVDNTSNIGSVSTRLSGSDASSSDGDLNSPTASSEWENTNYKIPNMEQWLALRVHGGARNWPKLPSCFNTGEP